MRNRKLQTNSKKIQKIRRIPLWLHLKQKYVEECQGRERIKIIVLFRSYLMRNKKLQTNSKKIQKIRRILFWLYFKQK